MIPTSTQAWKTDSLSKDQFWSNLTPVPFSKVYSYYCGGNNLSKQFVKSVMEQTFLYSSYSLAYLAERMVFPHVLVLNIWNFK